jgi:hypothetical protein
MKKLIKTSAVYALAAILCGVFDREFTKWSNFAGITPLSYIHVHLFVLGMVLFLVLALFAKDSKLTESKEFDLFYLIFNIALPWTVVIMLTRGILAVEGTVLSHGIDTLISVLAGLGHLGLTVGLVFMFLALLKTFGKDKEADQKQQ